MNIFFKTCVSLSALGVVLLGSCSDKYESGLPKKVTFSQERLMDKSKGGWACQTIGVTY